MHLPDPTFSVRTLAHLNASEMNAFLTSISLHFLYFLVFQRVHF